MTLASDASSPPALEVYFDCSSPWTYLGFHNVQKLAARFGIEPRWKPIIVGGVFNQVNPDVYGNRERILANPRKGPYQVKDLTDWASYSGIVINFPPKCGHPVNSAKCMRACLFLEPSGRMLDFATAAFEALWVEGLDLGNDDVLRGICVKLGVPPEPLLAAVTSDPLREKLRQNTQELMDRGGFGSPSFFVGGTDMYFGNDRLPLVEVALKRLLES